MREAILNVLKTKELGPIFSWQWKPLTDAILSAVEPFLESGPGEEDGPWSPGWEKRSASPTSHQPAPSDEQIIVQTLDGPVVCGSDAHRDASEEGRIIPGQNLTAPISSAPDGAGTPTPETDAKHLAIDSAENLGGYARRFEEMTDFARKLEQQRDALKREISGLNGALVIANRSADDQMRQKRAASQEVEGLKREVGILEETIKAIEAVNVNEFGGKADLAISRLIESLPAARSATPEERK